MNSPYWAEQMFHHAWVDAETQMNAFANRLGIKRQVDYSAQRNRMWMRALLSTTFIFRISGECP